MNTSPNQFFDDMQKIFGSAMNQAGHIATDAKRTFEDAMRGQIEYLLHKMDLVTREEHEVVKDMAAKARAEQEELAKKLAMLEKKINAKK